MQKTAFSLTKQECTRYEGTRACRHRNTSVHTQPYSNYQLQAHQFTSSIMSHTYPHLALKLSIQFRLIHLCKVTTAHKIQPFRPSQRPSALFNSFFLSACFFFLSINIFFYFCLSLFLVHKVADMGVQRAAHKGTGFLSTRKLRSTLR